jgi:hypothetical protein
MNDITKVHRQNLILAQADLSKFAANYYQSTFLVKSLSLFGLRQTATIN